MAPFSEYLFWDVAPDSIDWEKHRRYVIGRVLNRGVWSDWKALKTLYSLEIIAEEVILIRDLSPKAVAFCMAVFDLKKEQFRCTNPTPF